VVALAVIAAAMELVLLLGWLRPLALWDHQVNPREGTQMVALLGRTRVGALRFVIPALLLVGLYLLALRVARRAHGRGARLVALAASVLFVATLIPMFPGSTQDIFHNVSDGRLFWRYGENPTLVPPESHPEDAFYPHLFGYNDLPSAYGPLWYALDGLPTSLSGDGLVAKVVAQKLLTSAFLLATVALVWLVARGTGREIEAVVLAGWCPLLLWETAGNGHNDAIMVFFSAAAVGAAVGKRWLWVFPLLALSVLVKFTTLLLGPVLLVWLLRRPDARRRTILAGLGLAALITVVAYVPFWAGTATLTFLHRPGMSFILSPATLLHGVLVGTLGDHRARGVAYGLTGAAFALLYVWTLWRVRPGETALLDAGFDGLFWYLMLASWWFWPWYLGWLAPLAAWRAGDRRAWAFALATGAALLTYCYWWSDPPDRADSWYAWYALITLAVFVVPVAVRCRPRRARTPNPAV
jgi:alpha-1,6-mannosyltransferase